ncbi:hypothetical protein C9374_003709 [Naegleria lovaniensis]|uniref:Spindle pole body component n=1 Tax=Naegleria lovaniensis TaxID=51637 RepID=A0AA88H3H3_NAELO|nr:uncharacterized protein C9374_003709 [Naegleria lovaniensis]KAG2393945.1 hypothetical protein C9374_003709 [Naegleria lovaniensis]
MQQSVSEMLDRLCRALILGPKTSSSSISSTVISSYGSDPFSMPSFAYPGSNSHTTTMPSNNSSEMTEKLLKKIKMNCFSYLLDKNDNYTPPLHYTEASFSSKAAELNYRANTFLCNLRMHGLESLAASLEILFDKLIYLNEAVTSILLILCENIPIGEICLTQKENNSIYDFSSTTSHFSVTPSFSNSQFSLEMQTEFFPNLLTCNSGSSQFNVIPTNHTSNAFVDVNNISQTTDITSLKRPLSDFTTILHSTPEKKKRSIYFTELKPDKLDEYKQYFERMCFGLNTRTMREEDIVKDCLLLFQGISSGVFVWDAKKFIFKVQPVRLKTLSFLGLRELLQQIAQVGSMYKRLEVVAEFCQNNITLTGKCLQSCGAGLIEILKWYKSCVLELHKILQRLVTDYSNQKSRLTLLNVIHHINPLRQRLNIVCEIFECDIQELNPDDEYTLLLNGHYISNRIRSIPTGAKLISVLYEKIQFLESSCIPEVMNILLLLFSYSVTPYLAWIKQWIFCGEIMDDNYGEFFVKATNNLQEPWYSFQIEAQNIPLPITSCAHDIFLIGNTLDTIRRCNPYHFILNDTVTNTIRNISILFTEKDLKRYEILCSRLQIIQHNESLMEMHRQLSELEKKIQSQEEKLKFGEDVLDRFQEEETKLKDKMKRDILDSYRKKMNITEFEQALQKDDPNSDTTLNDEVRSENTMVDEIPIAEPVLLQDETNGNLKLDQFDAIRFLESSSSILELPIEIVKNRSLVSLFYQQKQMVDSIFIKMLFHDYKINEHLGAINNYFLFKAGDLHDCFANLIYDGMKKGINYSDLYIINRTFKEAFKISNHAEQDNDLLTSNLFFDINPNSTQSIFDPNTIHSLDHIVLRYQVTYPVNIVLTTSAMDKYSQVHSLLLKLKIVDMALHEIWSNLKVHSKRTISQQMRYLHMFRQEVQHFVSVFKTFIFVEVIESSFSNFVNELFREKTSDNLNIEKLLILHNKFVESLHKQCLLGQSAKPVMDIIIKMFGLILKFKGQMQANSFNNEEDIPELSFKLMSHTRKEFVDCALFLDSLMDRLAQQSSTSKFGQFRMNYKFTY